MTQPELQVFHSQLQKDRPHSFKSHGESGRHRLVVHTISWWIQFCEHEANLAGTPVANYTMVETPPDDSRGEKEASSRLQRFYMWMLPHVQQKTVNTHESVLDKFDSTFKGLLFMQFQREGTPADIKEKYMYWKAVDDDHLKARKSDLKRASKQARADPTKTDIQGKSVGKTVTDDYVSLILNTQHYQCRLQLNDHLASQAQLAIILVCGNRGVRERRKKLICITSKPVRDMEMENPEGSLCTVPAPEGGHGGGCHPWGQAPQKRRQEHHACPVLSGRLVQEGERTGVSALEIGPVPAPPLADARAQSGQQPVQPAAAVELPGCPALPDITRLSLPKKKAAGGPGQHEGGSRRAKRVRRRRACMAEQSVGGISAASQRQGAGRTPAGPLRRYS